MSILEFVKVIVEMIGNDSGILFRDLPVDDPKIECLIFPEHMKYSGGNRK